MTNDCFPVSSASQGEAVKKSMLRIACCLMSHYNCYRRTDRFCHIVCLGRGVETYPYPFGVEAASPSSVSCAHSDRAAIFHVKPINHGAQPPTESETVGYFWQTISGHLAVGCREHFYSAKCLPKITLSFSLWPQSLLRS